MSTASGRCAGWLVAAALALPVNAVAQTGDGFDLSWHTVDGGGTTFSTGGSFVLGATAGQPDAGSHAAAPFALSGGFWFGAVETFTVAKDFSDGSGLSVAVSLTCSSGTTSPPSAFASESAAATFTVTGATGPTTCTAIETVPTGYIANQTGCAGVALEAGSCTLVNTAIPGSITVVQATLPTPDPSATSFVFTAGGGLAPTSFALTDGGSQVFSDLAAGAAYSVSQLVPAGWRLVSATCSDGSSPDSIDVGLDEAVVCTFVSVPVAEIPALDGGALVLLGVGLAIAALLTLRRAGV